MESLGENVGANEVSAVNSFVMGVVFSRFDYDMLRGLKDGLYSQNGAKVADALNGIAEDPDSIDTTQPAHVRTAISQAASVLGSSIRSDCAVVISEVIGEELAEMPPFADGNNPVDAEGFKAILTLVENHTLQEHQDYINLAAEEA